MVNKIYNIVLQSNIAANTSTSNEYYFYDWSQIPDVPYIVTFSFVSGVMTTTGAIYVASLYVDLSQPYNQLAMAQKTTPYYNRASFLGNLTCNSPSITSNFLYATTTSNPPTYLNGRPYNNNFLVEIHSTPIADYAPPTGPYCLIISLKEC